MANHPITVISPAQMIQSSIAANNDQFSSSNSSTPPNASQGDTSTGVSGGTEANVTVAPGTVAPDAYSMQSNDATAFVFGSTAAGQSTPGNQYTTVDDTAKSALKAATAEDQMVATIGKRGSRRPPFKKRKDSDKSSTTSEELEQEQSTIDPYSTAATRVIARAMEKGIVIM